jgi:phospholipid/cholesterol/gamma-HCH transport system substrate-binding protein
MSADAPPTTERRFTMNEFTVSLKKVKIGLTVFIGIIIFLVLMFLVGTESNTFTSTYRIKLFLPNINGLANGSMVTLGGLKIGNVESLEFGKLNERTGVIITTLVRTRYSSQITTGSVASVKTIGMLGDKYIDFTIGNAGEAPLNDGSFMVVKATRELGDVLDDVTGVMSDVAATASNVRAISDTIRSGHGSVGKILVDEDLAREISDITQKLHSMTQSLSGPHSTLGRLMQDDALYAKLDRTASNLSTLSDSLKTGKGTAGKLLMNDSLYLTLRSVSQRMDSLLAKMASDSSSVGAMINTTSSYRQLSELMGNINALVADIKENPKKYVHLSLF